MGSPSLSVRGLIAGAILSLGMMMAVPALAQQGDSLSAADGAAIRKVVEDQLAAFQRDDGEAAFGYASPMIHELFRTADNFMMMVRSGYQPVYRPRHVEFGGIDTVEGSLTQHVILTGPDGAEVEALYFMERESDGRWLINGCVLKPSYQA